MHPNSELIFEKYAARYFESAHDVLELGADGDPSTYERRIGRYDIRWAKAELSASIHRGTSSYGCVQSSSLAYIMPSEYVIPAPNDSFDVVLAGNVLEHVRKPWLWLPELSRVARPGGFVVLISPISWEYHEAPIDCWRVYPDGLRGLCEEAALTPLIATFGSLERAWNRRAYYGNTWQPATGIIGIVMNFVVRLGWPHSRACDSLLVAQKASDDCELVLNPGRPESQ